MATKYCHNITTTNIDYYMKKFKKSLHRFSFNIVIKKSFLLRFFDAFEKWEHFYRKLVALVPIPDCTGVLI